MGHVATCATLLVVNQSWRWVPSIDVRAAAFATLLLGTSSSFTAWARAGMETALQASLVAGLIVWYLRVHGPSGSGRETESPPRGVAHFVVIGLICALLGMNRPDGLLIVAVVAADALLRCRQIGGGRVAVTATVFAVVFGGYYAWRWSYFGYPFPNTFYAKVGSTGTQVARGLGYVVDAARALAPLLILLPIMSAAGWRKHRELVVLLVLFVVYTAYIVGVGGDIMPAERFFTPVLPALCLLGAASLASLRRGSQVVGLLLAVGYGVTLMFTTNVTTIRSDVIAVNGKVVGEWLRDHAPRGSTVALNSAGATVYYSKLRAIDMLGLNDLHIAHVDVPDMGAGHAGHEKGDGGYVLDQRPEFIQLGASVGWAPTPQEPEPPWRSGKEIWAELRFQSGYTLFYTHGDTYWPRGKPLGLFGFYVRNDIYPTLPKAK